MLFCLVFCLEHAEGLFASTSRRSRFMSDNIESDSLGKRTALSNGDDITFLDSEGRTAVNSNVLVSLFKTTVLGNVMQIISTDNDGTLHLGGDDQTLEDTSTNTDISSERTFLIHIGTFNGSIWSLDTQTNITDKTHRFLTFATNSSLTSYKDGILLLISLFMLYSPTIITIQRKRNTILT